MKVFFELGRLTKTKKKSLGLSGVSELKVCYTKENTAIEEEFFYVFGKASPTISQA